MGMGQQPPHALTSDFDEHLMAHHSRAAGELLAGRNEAGVPRGYWNFSWVAEDKLSFPKALVPASDHRCPGDDNSKSCAKRPVVHPEVTWSIVAAQDLGPDGGDWRREDKEGSPQGWEEGPSTNILTLSDKVNAFTKKLQRWAARAESGDFEMFSELHDFLESDMNANSLKESITCHLRSLLDKFNQYFLTENVEPFDWVRQPFTNCSSNNLPSELEDALIELSSDRTLQASFASKTLDEFWLSVVQEYPGLSKAAMDILTPFGSTYLCEKTFSSLAYIKNKYRCRLNSMEENLRVAVSSIDPRIDLLCSRKQAHPSH
ncbi:hypothetical protein NHX12_034281 [Muraenolepis orangiensis]|uniref:HAT C-terminal dimerisation domain-containing protein n=1 Tax=Muraenolepis orangiensis TaxID=630683 RepID=A0A9Q0I1Z0_9TELE|nr:hypothetical protein NHX12_034281 [Muraenolepis orangiensis]